MRRQEFVAQIPYGTRDFLPAEAKNKRDVENALAALFSRWGYNEVVTPTFEYLETMMTGVGGDMQPHMFKFLDKNNRILALRPDMTAPIARVAASRLREQAWPVKLFYLTNVFRYEQAQAGRQCEFYQAGVELMGVPGPVGDAEVIALAVETMLEAGLRQFQISLGQVQFLNGIMEEYQLSAEQCQQFKQCIVTRNLVGLREWMEGLAFDAQTRELFNDIPVMHGKDETLERAAARVKNPVSRQALDNLSRIYQLLKHYGVADYVNFDLGLIRDFDYYTGMVFEAYTPGLGFPLCGGGRYDSMLQAFGVDCPATGFAVGIERLLLALERQGLKTSGSGRDVYIGWGESGLAQAIATASELRGQGLSVELAMWPQERQQAEESQQQRGFSRMLYFT